MIIFWSLGDHRWKSSFLVPDQSSGVQNDELGRAEKMAEKKNLRFFFKGPNFSAQKGQFFNFSHCKWSFLIDRRSSLEIPVFSPRSKLGGAKRPARTGREDGREKNSKFFLKGRILARKTAQSSQKVDFVCQNSPLRKCFLRLFSCPFS